MVTVTVDPAQTGKLKIRLIFLVILKKGNRVVEMKKQV